MEKKKLWLEYKEALNKVSTAKDKVTTTFKNLFKIGREVHYQRQSEGPIHTGHILDISFFNRRLYVTNIKTGRKYWIDSWWLRE